MTSAAIAAGISTSAVATAMPTATKPAAPTRCDGDHCERRRRDTDRKEVRIGRLDPVRHAGDRQGRRENRSGRFEEALGRQVRIGRPQERQAGPHEQEDRDDHERHPEGIEEMLAQGRQGAGHEQAATDDQDGGDRHQDEQQTPRDDRAAGHRDRQQGDPHSHQHLSRHDGWIVCGKRPRA